MMVGRTPDGSCEPWSSQSQSHRGGPLIGPTRREFARFVVAVLVVSTRGPVCLPSRDPLYQLLSSYSSSQLPAAPPT